DALAGHGKARDVACGRDRLIGAAECGEYRNAERDGNDDAMAIHRRTSSTLFLRSGAPRGRRCANVSNAPRRALVVVRRFDARTTRVLCHCEIRRRARPSRDVSDSSALARSVQDAGCIRSGSRLRIPSDRGIVMLQYAATPATGNAGHLHARAESPVSELSYAGPHRWQISGWAKRIRRAMRGYAYTRWVDRYCMPLTVKGLD